MLAKCYGVGSCICRTVSLFVKFPQGEGSEFWVLASGPGPCHSWVRALGEMSFTALEFAFGRVDIEGGIKIYPLNLAYQ